MYEKHQNFLNGVAGYDCGLGGCTLQQYEDWLKSLKCKVIKSDVSDSLEKNLNIIIDTYKAQNSNLYTEYFDCSHPGAVFFD